MSFNVPINEVREVLREYIYIFLFICTFCLNEIIAFRFSFKDNSLVSILILYIELIAHPLNINVGQNPFEG